MRRTLNFTGRIRISQSDISIQVSGSPLGFVAERRLDAYDLPPDAVVYLEAYRAPSYMRFDWGTVAHPRAPGSGAFLTNFNSEDIVLFRVKVVGAASANGMILAQADQIKTNVSDQSILPVYPKDLDGIVWHLSFDDDDPALLVNDRIDGIKDHVRSDPEFAALVFPGVLRDILERLCNEVTDGGDEQQTWVENWERFARSLMGRSVPRADDLGRDKWIDEAINTFAKRHQLLSRYQESLNART